MRTPSYLDLETLVAQAEYHDVDVPRREDIVERRLRQRSAGGKAGVSGFGASATFGTDAEFQRSYTLNPSSKATVSKVIDALVAEGAVKVDPDGETSLSKDDLVEIDGVSRITAASLDAVHLSLPHRDVRTGS